MQIYHTTQTSTFCLFANRQGCLALAGLELPMEIRLVLNFQPTLFCLYFFEIRLHYAAKVGLSAVRRAAVHIINWSEQLPSSSGLQASPEGYGLLSRGLSVRSPELVVTGWLSSPLTASWWQVGSPPSPWPAEAFQSHV